MVRRAFCILPAGAFRCKLDAAKGVETLSRAFTKELDGWNFCRARQRECSDAAFNGRCERDCCKYKEDDPNDPAAQKKKPENAT